MKLALLALVALFTTSAHAADLYLPLVMCQPVDVPQEASAMTKIKAACANGGELDRNMITGVEFTNRLQNVLTLHRDDDNGYQIEDFNISFKNLSSAMNIMNALTSGKIKTLVLDPSDLGHNYADGAPKFETSRMDVDGHQVLSLDFTLLGPNN